MYGRRSLFEVLGVKEDLKKAMAEVQKFHYLQRSMENLGNNTESK